MSHPRVVLSKHTELGFSTYGTLLAEEGDERQH